jgi:malate synthase
MYSGAEHMLTFDNTVNSIKTTLKPPYTIRNIMHTRNLLLIISLCTASFPLSHAIEATIPSDTHAIDYTAQKTTAFITRIKYIIDDIKNKQQDAMYTADDDASFIDDAHRLTEAIKDLSNHEIRTEQANNQASYSASALFSVFSGLFIVTNGIFFIIHPEEKEYIINVAAASVLTTLSAILSLTYKDRAKAIDSELHLLLNKHNEYVAAKNPNDILTIPQRFFNLLTTSIEACECEHHVDLSVLKYNLMADLHAIETEAETA